MISDLRKNSSRAINRNKFFSSNSSPGKKRNLETQQVVAVIFVVFVVFVAVDAILAGGVAVAVVAIPVDVVGFGALIFMLLFSLLLMLLLLFSLLLLLP